MTRVSAFRAATVALAALSLCALGACAGRQDNRQGDAAANGNFHLFTLAPIMVPSPVLLASADMPGQAPARERCRRMRPCPE